MPQVIIVSNRLPVSVKREEGQLTFYPSVGGLATGLSSYVKNRKNLWIGWPGIASDELSENDQNIITLELAKHNCVPVFLTKQQIDDYYNGYSNTILWPLFHSLRTPLNNKKYAVWWKTYKEVNKIFTDTVLSMSNKDSTIWVHDYQLLLTPSLLRKEHHNGHIGFFLHIPFPNVKILSKIKSSTQLLNGMLGADLVGFHTLSYVNNFISNTELLLACKSVVNSVIIDERIVRITAFPMGIDYQKYADAAKSSAVKEAAKKYKNKYRGYKIIASVDRLDPSKGLIERLRAYNEFLTRNPDLHKKVVFCMVAAPSRTEVAAYQNLKIKIDQLVQEINQRFSYKKWFPIDYIEGLPFEEVIALFKVADVAFITPLIDGMNLVAKEFIASKQNDGVLILSETAGAAEELKDAIIVNPRNIDNVIESLHKALTMPKNELIERLNNMQQYLSQNTVHSWANNFMKSLALSDSTILLPTKKLSPKLINQLHDSYQKADKRLLILDYDGTLVPFTSNFKKADPSIKVIETLKMLANDQRNDIIIISGRSQQDLQKWFNKVPLNLIAEHGMCLLPKNSKTWQCADIQETHWKEIIRPILEIYAKKTPESSIEDKLYSLVWHYRESPAYYAQKYAVIIKQTTRPLLKRLNIELHQGNKVLEFRTPGINKGTAVRRFIDKSYGFILAIGDDYTDEDIFLELQANDIATKDNLYLIKVGPGKTQASFRALSSKEIIKLLNTMSSSTY